MADAYCFVDPTNGSDSTGTGALATPFKTLTKAAGSSPAFPSPTSSGTNYVVCLPGLYTETLALGMTPTSSAPLVFVGDSDGAFQRLLGSTAPVTGLMDWRGWSNNTTVINGSNGILYAPSKSYVTLRNMKLTGCIGGNMSCFRVSGTSSDWTFEKVHFFGSIGVGALGWLEGTAGSPLNMAFKKCLFWNHSNSSFGLDVRMPVHSAEYDINLLFENCRFFNCGTCVRLVNFGGTGSFYPTGMKFQNCAFNNANTAGVLVSIGSNVLTTPSTVYGCTFELCGTAVSCGHVSQLVENGNKLYATTARTVVGSGANSITTASPSFDVDDHLLSGLAPRPIGTPSLVSASAGAGQYGTVPTEDATGRPRPAGFGSLNATIGPLERHDTARKESTTTDSGDGAAIDGPGNQYLSYAVDAGSVVISLKARYDTNHGATNKPQVAMLANPAIGVAAQTITMTAAANTWETITFSSITPTAKGRIRIQLIARPSAANGIMFADTVGP